MVLLPVDFNFPQNDWSVKEVQRPTGEENKLKLKRVAGYTVTVIKEKKKKKKLTKADLYFKLSSSTCLPVVTFWLSICSSKAFILKKCNHKYNPKSVLLPCLV